MPGQHLFGFLGGHVDDCTQAVESCKCGWSTIYVSARAPTYNISVSFQVPDSSKGNLFLTYKEHQVKCEHFLCSVELAVSLFAFVRWADALVEYT